MVIIDNQGVEKVFSIKRAIKASSFEYIYFARPDSVIDGMSVYEFRHTIQEDICMSNILWKDIVYRVPDSRVPQPSVMRKQVEFLFGRIIKK